TDPGRRRPRTGGRGRPVGPGHPGRPVRSRRGTPRAGRRAGQQRHRLGPRHSSTAPAPPALGTPLFARRHVARGATWGRIIGLTSGGDLGFPEEVSYGAAKAAQANYTMAAALELAQFGITANIVYPPVTDTGWVTDTVRQAVASSKAHIHIAKPAE